jgi:hypothetical protein
LRWDSRLTPCHLMLRRGASRYASPADLYCAFGMAFLRGCYHQILGPRRHLPKFSNSLCRHAGAHIRLNLHLGWQAAESYVERSNAFALIPGHRVLADCPAAELRGLTKQTLSNMPLGGEAPDFSPFHARLAGERSATPVALFYHADSQASPIAMSPIS